MDKDTRLRLMYPIPDSGQGSWLDWMKQEQHLPKDVEYLRQLALAHYTIEESIKKLTHISGELGRVNFAEATHIALERISEAERILAPYLSSLEAEIDEKTQRPARKAKE